MNHKIVYKKIIAIILTLTMFIGPFGSMGINVYANEQPGMEVYCGISGNKMTVYVQLKHVKNLASMQWTISYNTEIMTYMDYTSHLQNSSGTMLSVNQDAGTITNAIVDLSATDYDQVVLEYCFDIICKESREAKFNIQVIECKDSNLNNIALNYSTEMNFGYVSKTDNFKNTFMGTVSSSGILSWTIGTYDSDDFYTMEFELDYNKNMFEYIDFEKMNVIKDAIVDVNSSEKGKLKIAIISNELITVSAEYLKLNFVVLKEYENEIFKLTNLKFTDKNLSEHNLNSEWNYSTPEYIEQPQTSNYIKLSAPERVSVGETFDALVEMVGNTGFSAMTLSVLYQSDVFEYVDSESISDTFSNAISSIAKQEDGRIKIAVASADTQIENGIFAKFRFKVKKNVSSVSELKIVVDELMDANAKPVSSITGKCFIAIEASEENTTKPGSEEETTEKPGFEEETTEKPGSEEESTKKPGSEEESTKKPGSEEESTKKPGSEEESTKKPDSEEETTKKPSQDLDAIAKKLVITNLKQRTYEYGTSVVSMSWKKVADADGYAIYRSSTKNGSYKYLKTINTNSYKNYGLKAGNYYYYKIRAFKNVNGKKVYGAYSAVLETVTKPSQTPDFKQSTTKATNYISLSWGKVQSASGYEIYRSASKKGTYKLLKSQSGTSFKNTKLKSGTRYYYKVRAYRIHNNQKVYGGFSRILGAMTKPVPPALTFTAGSGSIKISWNKISGCNGYELFMSSSKNGTYQRIKSANSYTLSYKKTKLSRKKTYYFKIRSYVKDGTGKKIYSGYSTIKSVKTK